jgi:hypothetical protein
LSAEIAQLAGWQYDKHHEPEFLRSIKVKQIRLVGQNILEAWNHSRADTDSHGAALQSLELEANLTPKDIRNFSTELVSITIIRPIAKGGMAIPFHSQIWSAAQYAHILFIEHVHHSAR